ncbi:hypothetical protein ACHOLT_06635 [Desulfitobacterium sp. Sab5]|uniref:hypothetical protein n=1 Tax=Desulfitobacterium nosdiversum TaxID=3375356 RepID=UPI003CE6CF27
MAFADQTRTQTRFLGMGFPPKSPSMALLAVAHFHVSHPAEVFDRVFVKFGGGSLQAFIPAKRLSLKLSGILINNTDMPKIFSRLNL